MKFDVIITNPPFQDSSKKTQGSKLWINFIEKFSDLAEDSLCFITPDPWTHPESSRSRYKKLFRQKNLTFANIGECSRHFPGVGSSFTWFILENKPYEGPTTLQLPELTMDVDFRKWKWIPNKIDNPTLEALYSTLWNNGPKIEYVGSQLPKEYHSKGQTEEFRYPFCLSTSTTSWRKEKCKYQDVPKVMFPYLASHTRPILDEGELGATHGVNLIFETLEEAKSAYDFYMGEDLQKAMKVSKWHHGNANPQVLKTLPIYTK